MLNFKINAILMRVYIQIATTFWFNYLVYKGNSWFNYNLSYYNASNSSSTGNASNALLAGYATNDMNMANSSMPMTNNSTL